MLFLVVNILDLSDFDIEQLKKFHKSYYNVDAILSTAQGLKYTTSLKAVLLDEVFAPSDDFVRAIAKKVYEGVFNQKALEQFRPLVAAAVENIINDRISDRLGLALKSSKDSVAASQPSEQQPSDVVPSSSSPLPEGVFAIDESRGIVTTQDEIDGYLIVKAIVRSVVDVSRVVWRDAQTYFSVLLDDNNRKPICRLRLNAKSVKYLELINPNGSTSKEVITSLDDIYKYSSQLCATAVSYDNR